jgi:hypothetical protein
VCIDKNKRGDISFCALLKVGKTPAHGTCLLPVIGSVGTDNHVGAIATVDFATDPICASDVTWIENLSIGAIERTDGPLVLSSIPSSDPFAV